MAKKQFYLRISAALLLSLSAATVLSTSAEYAGVIAGASAISSLLLMRSAERTSRMEGRTDRMKVALTSSTVLYELILLLGAVSLAVVPKYAVAIVFAAVAFTEILQLETEQKLRTAFTPDIGREGRIVVLGASLVAYSFNTWFLFYGILFLALLAIYDSLRLIHHINDEI